MHLLGGTYEEIYVQLAIIYEGMRGGKGILFCYGTWSIPDHIPVMNEGLVNLMVYYLQISHVHTGFLLQLIEGMK